MILVDHIDDYKFYENLWYKYRDTSTNDSEFNTIGFDIGEKGKKDDWHKLHMDNVQQILMKNNKIIFLQELIHAWGVEYQDGGYQTLHTHANNTINTVLFLDSQPVSDRMSTLNGLLYTVDNMKYQQFAPEPGKIVIFSSDVFHGVYPSKAPRRSFMVDYRV